MRVESEVLYLEFHTESLSERDNFEEIRKAFLFVQNNNIEKIVFPSGSFLFSNDAAQKHMEKVLDGSFDYREKRNIMVSLENVSNIEIEGNNSTLIFKGFIAPFDFFMCNNLVIKNLTIDWQRPAFSEGIAEKISQNEVCIKVDENYDLKGGEAVPSYQDCDNDTGVLSGLCVFGNREKLVKTSSQTVALKNEFASSVKAGNRVIMRHVLNGVPCFHLLECKNIQFYNVVIHATPGMGIIGHKSAELSFEKLCVKPSQGRMLSTNADATHFISCYGNITFKNCFFSSMGDDAVNVHGFYLAVKKIISPRELLLTIEVRPQDSVFDTPQLFDQVEFVKRSTLFPYAEAQIIEVKNIDMDNSLVQIVLDRDLPENFELSDIVANTTKTAKLMFLNCTVKNIRGRAALVQTRNALIENCCFENCTGQGVHIDTATGWWESIGTRNVTVRKNKFLNCGYGSTKYCDGVGVVIETECSESKTGIHKGINISDNYIKGKNTGILVRCADGVNIENNIFEIDEAFAHIDIDFSENVKIFGENFSEDRIRIGKETDNISVENTKS